MKHRIGLVLIASIIGMVTSCEKPEGTGGTSSIVGKIWVRNYNADFSRINAEYWGEEVDVYIMYGNDTIHSDDTKTSYNGSYKFDYLQKGDYTIYAYSDDSTMMSPSGRIPVKASITIKEAGEEYLVPTITVLE